MMYGPVAEQRNVEFAGTYMLLFVVGLVRIPIHCFKEICLFG
jgi:hypothetical protein